MKFHMMIHRPKLPLVCVHGSEFLSTDFVEYFVKHGPDEECKESVSMWLSIDFTNIIFKAVVNFSGLNRSLNF